MKFIIWRSDKPTLLCEKVGDNEFQVVNGAWSFELLANNWLRMKETGDRLEFTAITAAPDGRNYNEVLDRAAEIGLGRLLLGSRQEQAERIENLIEGVHYED